MKSYHKIWYLGFEVICENGMYRLPNRVDYFSSLDKMKKHIEKIENNFKNIMNRIDSSRRDCTGDSPHESSLK